MKNFQNELVIIPNGIITNNVIRNLSKNKRYLGATSASQILRNNGYTPVNQEGIINIPKKSYQWIKKAFESNGADLD